MSFQLRLGKGIPHPWWHVFFTEWINDQVGELTGLILCINYRCHKCKTDFTVRPKEMNYKKVDLR